MLDFLPKQFKPTVQDTVVLMLLILLGNLFFKSDIWYFQIVIYSMMFYILGTKHDKLDKTTDVEIRMKINFKLLYLLISSLFLVVAIKIFLSRENLYNIFNDTQIFYLIALIVILIYKRNYFKNKKIIINQFGISFPLKDYNYAVPHWEISNFDIDFNTVKISFNNKEFGLEISELRQEEIEIILNRYNYFKETCVKPEGTLSLSELNKLMASKEDKNLVAVFIGLTLLVIGLFVYLVIRN
jgi:hypothetical protein